MTQLFHNWRSVPFDPLPPFCLTHPCLWQPPICSLYLWGGFVFLDSHVSEIIPYLSFSVWLISFNALEVHPCCHKWQDFPLFLWLNAYVCVCECVFSFPSDKFPEVELMDHMVVLRLIFWGTSMLFSTVALPIYIPSNRAQGFPFLHTLADTFYFLSFW